MKTLRLVFIFVLWPASVFCQLISIKTVPVATGEQFRLFPAQNLGTGDLSIAVNDIYRDSFVNPAKGARRFSTMLHFAPYISSVSDDFGMVRTLPFSFFLNTGKWFGAISASIQQLDEQDLNSNIRVFGPPQPLVDFAPFQGGLEEKSNNNRYLHAHLGRRLPDGKSSLGISATWADLSAVGGVNLLYSRSQDIDQSGDMYEIRLGYLKDFSSQRALEVLFLYNYFDMQHDVYYSDWLFLDAQQDFGYLTRLERNLDRTITTGMHLGYTHGVPQSEWQIGGILTINHKTHPKIANYELMNIPRDPGTSWAYNLGIGLARNGAKSMAGIDIIYEPVWSHTWAEAAENIETTYGTTIFTGQKTIENRFDFSNYIMRAGISREKVPLGFQLGLEVHAISYRLRQKDYIFGTIRSQKESWTEWRLTWGLLIDMGEFDLRYSGSYLTGTGLPGVVGNFNFAAESMASDFVVAPSGALTLQEASVITHQVTLSIPISE